MWYCRQNNYPSNYYAANESKTYLLICFNFKTESRIQTKIWPYTGCQNHFSITVNKDTKCTSNFWVCMWYPKVTQTTSNLFGSIIAWYTWTAETLHSHNQLQYSLCFMTLISTKTKLRKTKDLIFLIGGIFR